MKPEDKRNSNNICERRKMGDFSWLRADGLTRIANIAEGDPYKLLIPKEFGGGYIPDHYRSYGRIAGKVMDKGWNVAPRADYDIYELLYNINQEYLANRR